MITILLTGMLLTALALAVLWGGFKFLQKRPAFSRSLNSRTANKRMLQLTLLIYFSGIIITIAILAA